MRPPALAVAPWSASPLPGLTGLAARAATVATVAALLGTSTVPGPAAPTATRQAATAPVSAASAPSAPAPAVTATATRAATPATGLVEVDAENIVSGAASADLAVVGVAEEARAEAPAAGLAEEVAALTSPEGAELRFQGLGVTWDASTTEDVLSVQVRLREDGEWTGWTALEQIGDRVESDSPRTGTDPLLTDGADGYQVEVRTASGRTPEGLQVNLVDPGVGSLDGQLADMVQEASETPVGSLSSARVDAATGAAVPTASRVSTVSDRLMPTIVRRSAWGADESSAYRAPQNARLSAMYIHHTASSNAYSRATAVAQLRAIHHYHAEVLGWGDIGYHILVDKYGTIYEGARGSLDSLPRGAHAYGFNRDTFAVSAIGDYSQATPSRAMVDAITRVVAWKSAAHGLDPDGTVTLTSAGNAKYAAGVRVRGDAVRGHYATDYTACPGTHLITRLPAVRRDAAALIARAEGRGASFPTPDRASAVTPAATGTTYAVRPNDGWWVVSQRTGVSAARLQRLNGMGPRTVLHPGTVLRTAPRAAAHAAPSRTAVVTGASLVNLRAGSSTSTARVGRVKRGTPVHISRTAKDGAWAYVTHPSFQGWMSTAYLR